MRALGELKTITWKLLVDLDNIVKACFRWFFKLQQNSFFCSLWGGNLRAALHYSRKDHQSRIVREFWNMIGWEWSSCLVEVYTTVKSQLVENFTHRWKNEMAANMAILIWRGIQIFQRSSFLENLKASNKKLNL